MSGTTPRNRTHRCTRTGRATSSSRCSPRPPPDLLVTKQVNSELPRLPRPGRLAARNGLTGIVVTGITTNHCCETTARVGGNLGYDVRFVLDATYTFDRTGPDGTTMTADELARATATNLHGEFATVVSTRDLLAALRG